MKNPIARVAATLAVVALLSNIHYPLSSYAQGTAFTYQGVLKDTNGPVSGFYDLRFTLYDHGAAGPSQDFGGVSITNGLFTVFLDFGAGFFTNGGDRSLEIATRPTLSGGSFSTLSPQQPITRAPYAIFADMTTNLQGTLPASQLSGTIANNALPSSPTFSGTVTAASFSASTFSGSGANLTSLNANNISSGTLADARLSSNVALRAGGNTFTNTQTFNGPITLNSSGGFDQSSVGNFYIDAPFLQGGRLAVLENGNVGIGVPAPSQKLQVNGAATLTGLTVNGAATVNGALNLPSPASIYAGTDSILRSDANQDFFAGPGAGKNATSGDNNTALGYQAFYQGTNSQFNTAVGDLALHTDTTGSLNTANGALALYSNTNGSGNTAHGYQALYANTRGSNNTAVGLLALNANTIGLENTAVGDHALSSNTSGSENTAVGLFALANGSAGIQNTAVGEDALQNNSGVRNIALGFSAGVNVTGGGENIHIGNYGLGNDSEVIRIGMNQTNAFVAGIYGTPVFGNSIVVNASGQLGVAASSQRFKQNIQTMGDASEVLLALQPVTFQYKPNIDPQGTAQFGLIAEQVETVDPDLVVHDKDHGIYTVRYEAVNAMLLNEFLKQHHKVEAQAAEIEALRAKTAELDVLKARLETMERLINAKGSKP